MENWLQRGREKRSLVSSYVAHALCFTLNSVEPENLGKSKFNTPEDMTVFAQKFDEGLKRVFAGGEGSQFVKFGSPRDNDPKHGIKSGRLTLTG